MNHLTSATSNQAPVEVATLARQGKGALGARRAELQRKFRELCATKRSLDMTRGKPSAEQLNLANAMLWSPAQSNFASDDNTDCRNYGGIDGLPEAKALFQGIFDVRSDQIIVNGNSSLSLMHDAIVNALLHGVPGGDSPWRSDRTMRFICPTPGYDRHFAICEHLGIEMVPVEMNDDGPDMEAVEMLVAGDPSVKGIWCVPKYSNPTGVTYSDETVLRLAAMPAAAQDFRVFWDNAYAEHHFGAVPERLCNMLSACEDAGHPDRVLMFASTSKISFAGAGLAALAASPGNIADAKRHLSIQTIGPDKLNQLRHVRFFKNVAGLREHWLKHAAILRPKFSVVQDVFDRELAGKNVASWSRPGGGYFVNLDVLDGCAHAVVALAAKAGVKLTKAGATFPYGIDPKDRNVRIAPSFPPLEDVREAMEIVAVCVELAAIDSMLQTRPTIASK